MDDPAETQSDMQAGTLPGGQLREAGREGAAQDHAGGGRRAGGQDDRQGHQSMQDNIIIFEDNCPMMYMESDG